HHLRYVGGLERVADRVAARRQRRGQRLFQLGAVDVPELVHVSEHVVAALERIVRVGQGVVARGGLRQAREHGELRQRELRERRAVVDLGGGREAVGAVPQE